MAKQNKRTTPEESRAAADYYKLHARAVNDLIQANEENSPQVSEEELQKYRSGPKLHLADWLKTILVKMWFAGSVCFFIFWGLSAYLPDLLDLLLVFAIALGVITDVLTNNILRYYAKAKGANDKWMMFPKKAYYTFFLNILYAAVLLVCVATLYTLINGGIVSATGSDRVPLGVGPILFGVFYTGFDLLFIRMKLLLRQIVSDAKENVKK